MILFIEDELFYNESYKTILELNEYKVKFERNINSAIEYFKNNLKEIHLVIIDIMMDIPENPPSGFNIKNARNGLRTGEEVLRLLNQIPNGEKIPKIILTNVSDEGFFSKYENSDVVKGCYKKEEINVHDLLVIVKEFYK